MLIDYFAKRKLRFNLIIEKIPFFLLSIAFGIIAILSQDESSAIKDVAQMFSIPERLMIVSYSLMVYILKLFAPINLAAMYPYPRMINEMLPSEYFIAPIFVLILIVLIFISKKRNNNVIFGSLFFLVTISIVLQLIPVGDSIMAERYTYIPYIGLFLILGYAYVDIIDAKSGIKKKIKPIVNIILVLFVLYFSYLSWERVKIWKDSEVLFTDELEKYPDHVLALNNRGNVYLRKNLYEKALKDYSKCIAVDSTYHMTYSNRGALFFNMQKYQEAVQDFNNCLILKPDNTDALIGRANSLSSLEKFTEAISDYDKYIQLKPDNNRAYIWRGIARLRIKNIDGALRDFD
ncbi:MAG: tetratricopeptide repeat protein, partial [Bacteroidales bacterium]|nr:tetratricopeptide repeat protein [Bacteroidales bacterium]